MGAIVMHTCIDCNTPAHFTGRPRAPDNAFVHTKGYTTAPAKALLGLCLKLNRSKGFEGFDLVRKGKNGLQTVNANGLSNAMLDKGIKLGQPTITRLLNGADPKIPTVRALARFFKVDTAEIRGESISSSTTPRAHNITPIESAWPFFPPATPERLKHLSRDQRLILSGWLDAKIDLLEAEANAGNSKQPG